MQIDFHHAVTYVVARIAGFDHSPADIIATSAQYVDDAVTEGVVHFDNQAMYTRIHSAHKVTDVGNLNNDENAMVWLPFHFMPGNGGKKPGEDPAGSFIQKIICRRGNDSPPAQEMMATAIKDNGKPYSLHRFGIAMHVYADTWAHQGFAGVIHEVNNVQNAREITSSGVYKYQLRDVLSRVIEDTVPPLGHGRAQEFPDIPFLSWQYENGRGTLVPRNNPADFCEAADAMCRLMQRYLGVPETGIGGQDKNEIKKSFTDFKDLDGNKRHQRWLDNIESGAFSFGPATISYAAEGKNSWKEKALGSSWDLRVHMYDPAFLTSNWKLFHDALQMHRLTVLHDILPKYGICAG